VMMKMLQLADGDDAARTVDHLSHY